MAKWLLCLRCGQFLSLCQCLPPYGGNWTWKDRLIVDDADLDEPFGYFGEPLHLDCSKKDPLFPILECLRCGKFMCECYKK